MIRKVFTLALISALSLGVSGCGDDAPSSPPAVAKPAPKRAPQAKGAVAEATVEDGQEEDKPVYSYNPASRRDPFEALLEVRKPMVLEQQVPLTPLQQYDLAQLRLIGVIIGKGKPMAMVSAPGGKSYILKKGVKVGRNNGVVIEVDSEGVLVQEKYYDFVGDVRESVQKIELPQREGAR